MTAFINARFRRESGSVVDIWADTESMIPHATSDRLYIVKSIGEAPSMIEAQVMINNLEYTQFSTSENTLLDQLREMDNAS